MYCLLNKIVYVPNTTLNTEYSPYFIIQQHVQYFTGEYSIKTAVRSILRQIIFKRNKHGLLKPYYIIQVTNDEATACMVKCLEHHRITFSFLLIIRALLVFFLLLACPCLLLPCHEQFAVVIQHPTLQLMHKRRDQIKTKSLYCHNTMNARVQVVKVFCANSAA